MAIKVAKMIPPNLIIELLNCHVRIGVNSGTKRESNVSPCVNGGYVAFTTSTIVVMAKRDKTIKPTPRHA